MMTFLTVVHVFACALLVLVVLIQSGKGAEISASFAGSSQTVFGSSGGANFFTRFTAGCAIVFMCTSVALTVLGSQQHKSLFESTGATAPAGAAAPGAQQQQPAGGAAGASDPAKPNAAAAQQQAPAGGGSAAEPAKK